MPGRGSRRRCGRAGRLELDPDEELSRNAPRQPWYRRLTLLEMILWAWQFVDLFMLHGGTLDPEDIDRGELAAVAGVGLLWVLIGGWALQTGQPADGWLLVTLGALHLVATLEHLVRRGWPSK